LIVKILNRNREVEEKKNESNEQNST